MATREATPDPRGSRLRAALSAVRSQVLDLLREASRQGLGQDAVGSEAVLRLQRVANDLGEAVKALPDTRAGGEDLLEQLEPGPSHDAAAALTLGQLTVPLDAQPVDKAERWLRILRLYGRVGAALAAVGVPEGPLATVAEPALGTVDDREQTDSEAMVGRFAGELARRSGSPTVDTVHVLFAVRKVFGSGVERALPLWDVVGAAAREARDPYGRGSSPVTREHRSLREKAISRSMIAVRGALQAGFR